MVDMTKYAKHSVNNYISEVKIRLGNVVQNILEIGELYVEACRKYTNARAKFRESFPGVREATWQKFEAIGKHKLAASAFFLDSSFASRLMKRKIPVKTQEKLVTAAGVNVWRKKEKMTVCVPFSEFTRSDEETVFDYASGKVRTEDEQRRFVETKSRSEHVLYEADVDGIRVNGKCFIPWDKVMEMYEKHKRNCGGEE